ncbi:MAG: hypothetical protein ACC656_13895, partial [Candidatus Heimdallarchaeota archaeon]
TRSTDNAMVIVALTVPFGNPKGLRVFNIISPELNFLKLNLHISCSNTTRKFVKKSEIYIVQFAFVLFLPRVA